MEYCWRNGRAYKKVSKTRARVLFDRGEWVYLMPSKILFSNKWIAPAVIHQDTELSFDGAVDAFTYYNCNKETGRCAYYIEVKERY